MITDMKDLDEEKEFGTSLEPEELNEAEPTETESESDDSFDLDSLMAELIAEGSEEELNELKVWLFKENIRIIAANNDLNELKENFEEEKNTFYNEMRSMSRAMENDRKRLVQENRFFDQKMQILQSGFAQLDADRRKFQKEKDKFEAKREVYDDSQAYFARTEMASMLFKGVNSILALKKRYKDLIKMFHPDNVAGDHEMVQIINKEYDELKKAYDIGRQA